MLNTIRQTAKDTIVYGIGEVSGKLAAFMLIPLYTRVLTTADFGVLSIVLVLPALLADVINGGLIMAFYRFYFDSERYDQTVVTSTAAWFNVLFTFIAVTLMILWSPQLANLFFGDTELDNVVRFAALAMGTWNLARFGLALLRVDRRAKLYTIINLGRVCLSLGLIIYFVVVLRLGVVGILLGQVIADLTCVLYLIPTVLVRRVRWQASVTQLSEMLRYSIPLLPANIAGWITVSLPVILVGRLSTMDEAGLYGMASRLSWMITMLVTTPFQLGWTPIAFSIAETGNPKPTYARVFTYYVLIATWAGAAIAVLAPDALRILATAEYYAAQSIVPLLVLGAVLYGMAVCLFVHIEIAKRTIFIAATWGSASVVNVGLSLLLIPQLGRLGAAIAFSSAFLMAGIVAFFLSQQAYRIKFESTRLIKTVSVAVLLYIIGRFISGTTSLALIGRIAWIASYPVLLLALGFFSRDEKAAVRGLLKRCRRGAKR